MRHVAREVGMSPSGLQKFLAGSQPYSATRRKLERWHAKSGGEPDHHSDVSALEVLVHDLPPIERPRAMRQLLQGLEKVFPGNLFRRFGAFQSSLPGQVNKLFCGLLIKLCQIGGLLCSQSCITFSSRRIFLISKRIWSLSK